MKAMIMAAGVGSRLMPLTTEIPKPMVPIVKKPVMEYCVELLKEHGIRDIIANTHYKPDKITNYFKDGQGFGVNMKFSYEAELLGTAGGVKSNRWFLDEPFVIVSGDALTKINLTEMYRFHQEKRALATLALTPVENVSQYGVVVMDEANKIKTFQEKPKREEALSNMVNTGIYIFEPEIFNYIPDGVYDFGKQLFPKLAELNQGIYGYCTKDYWCDVGDLEIYKCSNWDVLEGIYPGISACVLRSSSLIGESTVIQGNVVIGENCYIGKNVTLKDCIIWDNCIIEDNVVIENSVVGNDCIIGSNVHIRPNAVLGSSCIIKRNAVIGLGAKIDAHSTINEGISVEGDLAV